MANSLKNVKDVILQNKGFVTINGVELLELQECKIKMVPQSKELNVMNSMSVLERKTAYKCTIEFKIAKMYTRFKKQLLKDAKRLQETVYDFTGVCENDNGEQESYRITDAWFNGEITLLELNSKADFSTETYTMGFMVENCNIKDSIDDEEDWD